jgi:tetratricopeptide (TPR) repeat protein
VQLFVERAKAVNSHFSLTPKNAPAVRRICQRLDGIPLALELAAARLKLFSAEQIAARLDDRFRLLTGGSRTALPRQQTLGAMIDWSYELLSEPEKALFRRLSVFAGGWSFEAAEAVCTGEVDGGLVIEPVEVLDLLAQLVNKSLVLVDEQGEESRYHFLETVRQYASEKLVASGEAAQVRYRHMIFFAGQASQDHDRYLQFSPGLYRRMAWLERELDNLRLAQEWALEHNLDLALQIMADTYFLRAQRGYGMEALRLLRQAIQMADARPEYQPGGSPGSIRLLALAWMGQGALLMAQGQAQASLLAYDHSLLLSHSVNAEDAMAYALFLKTTLYQITSDPEAASVAIEEAMVIARRLGDQQLITGALMLQASIMIDQNGYIAGRDLLLKAMHKFDQEKNNFGSAMTRNILAFQTLEAGDYDEAQKLYQECYTLNEQEGLRGFQNVARSGLAEIARLKGDYPRAMHLFQESIAFHLVSGNRGGIARCLECLAFIAIAQGQTPQAATLFGAAERIREASQSNMIPQEQKEYETKVAKLRTLLEQGDLQSAWNDGRALDLDRAVALASTLTAGEAAHTTH